MNKICEHGNRPEYCVFEVERANGDGDVVIEALDTILYETEGVRNLHYGLHDRVISRAFSFIEQLGPDGPGIERTVTIQHDTGHRPLRDAYNVELEWRPLARGTVSEEFVTVYAIDKYPTCIQACMEQPVPIIMEEGEFAEGREQCFVTSYDYEQLFDTLVALSARHERERIISRVNAVRMEGEERE